MRRSVAPAALLLSLFLSASAAEPARPAVPTLTAAARISALPAGLAEPLRAPMPPAREEAADLPTSRPWLLVLSVVVLAGVMARRRM